MGLMELRIKANTDIAIDMRKGEVTKGMGKSKMKAQHDFVLTAPRVRGKNGTGLRNMPFICKLSFKRKTSAEV
jgi:hypothetical protein